MKKFLTICFLCLAMPSFAQSLEGSISGSSYADYMEKINLSAKQKEQILKINKEEEFVLRPIVLDIHSHERGIEYLKSLKCGAFESRCKKQLKEDIKEKQFEKNELMRQINQKKNYYNLRYRNVLTREQDYQIKQMAQNDAYVDKVLKEREVAKKKQERKEKLKFWKKKN